MEDIDQIGSDIVHMIWAATLNRHIGYTLWCIQLTKVMYTLTKLLHILSKYCLPFFCCIMNYRWLTLKKHVALVHTNSCWNQNRRWFNLLSFNRMKNFRNIWVWANIFAIFMKHFFLFLFKLYKFFRFSLINLIILSLQCLLHNRRQFLKCQWFSW